MLYFKAVGIICVILSCTGYGIYKAMGFTKRVKLLRMCVRFAVFVREQMLFYRAELPSVFEMGLNREDLKAAPNLFYDEANLKTGFKKHKELTSLDCQILHEFAVDLGMSDYSTQKERCDLLIEQLNKQVAEAAEEQSLKFKLYTTLGLCAGACFTLIII